MVATSDVVRGFKAFIISLIACAVGIVTLILVSVAYVTVRPFSLAYYRKTVTTITNACFLLAAFITQKWSKLRIFTKGDKYPRDHSNLVILNHSSRTDWLTSMTWISLGYPYPGNARFVAMGPIEKIPIFGWLFKLIEFQFIRSKWAEDGERFKAKLASIGEYEEQTGYPLQLVLFPEGVILEQDKILISHDFARENNLPIFNNVLLPRTRGFREIVTLLRDKVDYVVDATVVFQPDKPSIYDVLSGSASDNVIFYTKKYEMSSLPNDADGLDDWLLQRWNEKEDLLEEQKTVQSLDVSNLDVEEVKPKYVFAKLFSLLALFFLGTMYIYHAASLIKGGRFDLLIISLLFTGAAIGAIVKNLIPDKRHKGPSEQKSYGSTNSDEAA